MRRTSFTGFPRPVDRCWSLCPEGAATYAAYKTTLEKGLISDSDQVVLYYCATGLKYEMPPAEATLDCTQPIDYEALK